MDVKEIVQEYLRSNNFDGLFCEHACGCKLDDLMPCDGDFASCEPGVRGVCQECESVKEGGCDSEFDWCIKPVEGW